MPLLALVPTILLGAPPVPPPPPAPPKLTAPRAPKAPPAPPAPRAFASTTALQSYALVEHDGPGQTRMRCSGTFSGGFQRSLEGRFGPSYAWFRTGGASYVVKDAGLLNRAHACFQGESALDSEERALEREEARLDQREEALDERLEQLEEREEALDEQEEGQAAPKAEQEALRKERAALESDRRAFEKERRELERRQRDLERRQEALEAQCEKALEQVLLNALKSGLAERVDSPGAGRKR